MIRRLIHTIGELFITVGALLLLFVVWQLWWTTVVADQEAAAVTQQLNKDWAGSSGEAGKPTEPPVDKAPAESTTFGIVHIPRFGTGYAKPIVQGTSLEDLKKGVGHYKETVMPGGVGNFSLAGHRTTYGAPLNAIADLKKADAIVVETKAGWYTYRVTSYQIVQPTQVSVVAAVPDKPNQKATERMLTLTSCNPMYSARERYVVHAKFDSYQQRSAGAPASLKG